MHDFIRLREGGGCKLGSENEEEAKAKPVVLCMVRPEKNRKQMVG